MPEIPIKYIARAHPKWTADTDYGKVYDHVMIQIQNEGRLEGSRLARVWKIGKLNQGDYYQDFLCVQWYYPVKYLENIRMQSYALSDEKAVISKNNLLRNVHFVPLWGSEIQHQVVPVLNPDIYQQYKYFVLNSQSDQAAWNYFY